MQEIVGTSGALRFWSLPHKAEKCLGDRDVRRHHDSSRDFKEIKVLENRGLSASLIIDL